MCVTCTEAGIVALPALVLILQALRFGLAARLSFLWGPPAPADTSSPTPPTDEP